MKSFMARVFLLSMVLGLSLHAYSLVGIVSDTNGVPVRGASITLESKYGTQTAVTTTQGKYYLSGSTSSRKSFPAQVTVSHSDYISAQKSVTLNRKKKKLNFTLEKISIPLEPQVPLTHVVGSVEPLSFLSGLVSIDAPYSGEKVGINDNETIKFDVEQDGLEHIGYVFATRGGSTTLLTGSFTFMADTDSATFNIDKLDDFITIDKPVNISLTSSYDATYLKVEHLLYTDKLNSPIVNTLMDASSKQTSGTFSLTQNGQYRVFQTGDINAGTRQFDGTVSITIDGKTQTIYIPSDYPQATQSWLGFTIEVYQGVITVIESNQGF